MSTELVTKEVQRAGRITDSLPNIGDYFWVKVEEDPEDTSYTFIGQKTFKKRGKKRKKAPQITEHLMCIEHIASNHIVFTRCHGGRDSYSGGVREVGEQLSFEDFMLNCRPAPEWRSVLENRMEQVRDAMVAETKRLYDDAQKANALPPSNSQFVPTESAPFALAVRTSDPVLEKRNLLALQKRIPEVVKNIEQLAREQAALAKMLMMPELTNLYAMQKKLHVVEDKIFTLEIYAGLQEQVKQIREGSAAAPDSRITVRQSLLFMDEETLIDFDKGGMDFRKLDDFDKWVARPENTDRILPEPRGIVALRVRRDPKDYGIPKSLWEALTHCEWHKENFETYLLLRNGEKLYRIASAVDFQPRLIPLRNEFDDAFNNRSENYNFDTHKRDEEVTRITPRDFEYDTYTEKLRNHLKQYNRVVVLLQGLLDRSEVFHPHAPINLSEPLAIEEWLNLVRDEEDGLEAGGLVETWEQYQAWANASLDAGDWIFTRYWDGRKRPYNAEDYPDIIQVLRRRKGTKRDVVPYRSRGYGQYHHVETYGRPEEKCVGIDGVEIEWDGGEYTVYPRERWRGSYDRKYTGHMWIPLTEVFNLMAYKRGDYKKFLCDRTQKGKYLGWAPQLLGAERWLMKKETEPKR